MGKMLLSIAVAAVLSAGFAKDKSAMTLNYMAKQGWQYAVTYHSECIFSGPNSNPAKKTNISCLLDAKLTDKKDKLDIHIKDLALTSQLYDTLAKAAIMKKLSGASYSIGLINGYPTIDTVNDFSQSGLPEWNLYLQLAKLIPEMPQQHLSPGYTWERSGILPIKTDQGTVDCEIYRHFKIDRVSPKHDSAYISWRFTYGSMGKEDSSAILRYVPIAGAGAGSAVIDVVHGFIVSAEIEFTTPIVALDNLKVNWVEKASMQYQGK